MGGIIVVDFIDMDTNENKVKLYKHMQELLANDRAKHNVLPLTKFGLMQITRQRVRPATEIIVNEKCPMCNGTGEISSSILVDETLERQLAYYVKEKFIKSFILEVNPVLDGYLNRGLFSSVKRKWCSKYGCKIKTKVNTEFTLLQAVWYNSDGERIDD